jgi:hypothetical protein
VVRRVTEVAEGVHRITNGVANFYLIEESGKVVLPGHGEPWIGSLDKAIRQAWDAGPS